MDGPALINTCVCCVIIVKLCQNDNSVSVLLTTKVRTVHCTSSVIIDLQIYITSVLLKFPAYNATPMYRFEASVYRASSCFRPLAVGVHWSSKYVRYGSCSTIVAQRHRA